MTRIYLDPTALVLPAPGAGAPDEPVAPGASEAIRHLLDAGFEVVLLGPEPARGLGLAGVERADGLPERLEPDAWFLTGEPHPRFGRPKGGTTVLVGPRRPPATFPLPRFDLEARDLASAAMEILTRQAMA